MREPGNGASFKWIPVPFSEVAATARLPTPRIEMLPAPEKLVFEYVRFGTLNCTSATSSMFEVARSSPENALTAIGMSWMDSSFLRAVTMISSIPPLSWGAAAAAAGAASCAVIDVALNTNSARSARLHTKAR